MLKERMFDVNIKGVKVPYQIFYFSCNLDHFLYNERNLAQNQKIDLAEKFCAECSKDEDLFRATICDDKMSAVGMDYRTSWDYIKAGNNSLSRFTNLNILLEDLK